jgi:TM2 domain-containing membrane protein YozV
VSQKWAALVLSALLPGLGQLYNGQWAKGAAFLAAFLVLVPSPAWLLVLGPVGVVGVVLLPLTWLWSMIDAWRGADRARSTTEPPPR